ncbi:MAG: hypothetical protein GY856_02950 [bacterium]|nr:hypothetical protein [bacterium]
MSEVDAVRQDFVQLWGSMAHLWGISPTMARVYSWLLSCAAPADTEEIMEGLVMSRGAVSMACRELRDWGLVFPEKVPGARRVSYRPVTDLEKVIRSIVQTRKRREWNPILEKLREWIPRLESEQSPEAGIFLQRLEALEAMATLADSLMEMFLKGGRVGGIGLKLLANAARHGTAQRTETVPEVEVTAVEETPPGDEMMQVDEMTQEEESS